MTDESRDREPPSSPRPEPGPAEPGRASGTGATDAASGGSTPLAPSPAETALARLERRLAELEQRLAESEARLAAGEEHGRAALTETGGTAGAVEPELPFGAGVPGVGEGAGAPVTAGAGSLAAGQGAVDAGRVTPPVHEASPATPVFAAHAAEAVPATARSVRARTYDAPRAEAVGDGAAFTEAGAQVPPAHVPPPDMPPPLEPAGAGASLPPRPPAPPRPAWHRRRERVWAILCHLFLLLVIPTLFLGTTLTFLVWQLKGKGDPLVEDQGREALNFQINVALLTAVLGVWSCVGWPLIPIVWVVAIVYAVLAARAVADGEKYRYPYVLRIVSDTVLAGSHLFLRTGFEAGPCAKCA